jgi:hypothetical protein
MLEPIRLGASALTKRCSLTSSIIASGLFLPIIVLIGQLHIKLTIGVEVLDYKPTGYVNYRSKDDQNDSHP